MPHLFADISAHGFGHLAQAAPVLERLVARLPGLRLTVRSALPETVLRQRIATPFEHLRSASDFGYHMIDALRIDLPATAAAYRAAHENFPRRIETEAKLLRQTGADAVFTDVSYLPLAGAALAGLPAAAMSSLNWADLFAHFFGNQPWAGTLHGEMLAAYRSASFLRLSPAMPMPALDDTLELAPIARRGIGRREALREKVSHGNTAQGRVTRLVLVALGGIPARLPVQDWPPLAGTHWLVPAAWQAARPDMTAFEPLGHAFADLLASVDAIVTKPGYGTFTEAVANGAAVLYQRRDDWPEQDCLIDWLHAHGRAHQVSEAEFCTGELAAALEAVLKGTVPPPLTFDGDRQAAGFLARMLGGG